MNTRAPHQPPRALSRRLLPLLWIGGLAGGIVSGLVGQHITDGALQQVNIGTQFQAIALGQALSKLGIACFLAVALLTVVATISASTRASAAREDSAQTPQSQQRLPVAARWRLVQTQGIIVAALLFVVTLVQVVTALTGDIHDSAVIGGLTSLLLLVSSISMLVLATASVWARVPPIPNRGA